MSAASAGAKRLERTALGEGVYDVFARKKRGEPLRHVGYVDAPGDELAKVYAWKTYDEENWFEMCVVPRRAVLPVNRRDGPWGRRRGEEAERRERSAADTGQERDR